MITRLEIRNPFAPHDAMRSELEHRPQKLLPEYLDGYEGLPATAIVTSVNGLIIPPEHRELTRLQDGDCLVIAPEVLGGGGGDNHKVLRTVLMLAVLAAAILVPFLAPIAALGHIAAAAIGAAIGIGGSLIINAILPPPTPKQQEQTQSYGWNGPAMLARQGGVIPKIYGQFRVSGNVISSYVETIGSKEYMNLLISLGWGPIRSVSDIRINDNPIANFKGVQSFVRYGFNDQAVLANFSRFINGYPQQTRLISGTPFTVSGQRTDTTAFQVEVNFPRGLYHERDDGTLENLYVAVKVEWGLGGSGVWNNYLAPRTTSPVSPSVPWIAVATDGNPFDRVVHATDSGSHYPGEPYSSTVVVNTYDQAGVLTTQTVTLTGQWQPNDATQNYVTVTNWYNVVLFAVGASRSTVRAVQNVALPSAGQWDVRVTKIGSGLATNTILPGENNDKRVAEETWLVNINEISNDAFSYPNQALLDIRALATDQLSGNGINVTAIVDAGDPESLGYKHSVGIDQPSMYWRLGEAAGATTAIDSSIYGNNGTYHGGVTLGKDPLLNRAPTTAALFDGVAGTTYVGVPAISVPTIFGFDGWLNLSAWGGSLFSKADGSVAFKIDGTGRPSFFFGGADHKPADPTIVIPLNVNVHVAVEVVGANWWFSLNGTQVAQLLPAPNAAFQLDRLMDGVAGTASDFAFYPKTLTNTIAVPTLNGFRIRKHYSMGISAQNLLESYTGNNPACVALDMLWNPLYGGGIDGSRFDVDAFKDWADFCNQVVSDGQGGVINRYTFNGVFDSEANLWDQLAKVGYMSRASVVRQGTNYSCVVDKPDTACQLFNVSNIIQDTFKETWLALQDRSNQIEIVYSNEQNQYKQEMMTVTDTAAIGGGDILKNARIQLFGCTNPAQAFRDATYRLLVNKLLKRTVTFDAEVAAIACKVGSVIAVQHDVPAWGQGGRFLDGSDTVNLKLDRTVSVDGVSSYNIVAKHPTLQRYAGTVSSVVGNTLYLSSFDNLYPVKRFVAGALDVKIISTFASGVVVDNASGILAGANYALYDIDVLETRAVAGSVAGDYSALTVTSPFSAAPVRDAVWTFGVVGKENKLFRVVSMRNSQDFRRTITAVEYSDAIYADTDPALPPNVLGYPFVGYVYPATATDDSAHGTRAWANPGNISADDGVFAIAQNSAAGATEDTHFLKARNFGLRVPPTGVPNGIVVNVDLQGIVGTNGTITNLSAQLIRADGAGSAIKTIAGPISIAKGFVTFGGPNDLWSGVWVPADLNHPLWTVRVWATLHTDAAQPVTQIQVDSVRLSVYFSLAARAQVSALQVGEAFQKIDQVYKTFVAVNWVPGQTTAGVDIYAAIDGKPEEFIVRLPAQTRYLMPMRTGAAVTVRVVGYDRLNNSAPYNAAPTGSVTLLGVTNNLLKNSTFAGSLAMWNTFFRAGDNITRSSAEDGYSQYNVAGSTLTTDQFPHQQTVLSGWAVGDYLMASGYVICDAGCTGRMAFIVDFIDSVGALISNAVCYYDLAGGAQTTWKRVNLATAVQIPVGTVSILFSTGIYTGVSVAVGKTLKFGHMLLEKSANGVTTPSTWADIDINGQVLDIFTNGGSTHLIGQGSTVPTIVGSISYTSTTSAITPTWAGLTILWPNKFTTIVQDGSLTQVTGLAAGTTYYAYEYFDVINGGVGIVPGNVGTPANLFTARSIAATQSQSMDGHVALANGAFPVATTSSGTGGGSGGGSGCPRLGRQVLRTARRGEINCEDVQVGEWIYANEAGELTKVIAKRIEKCQEFIAIDLSNGETLEQSPESIIPLADGSRKFAYQVCLNDILKALGELVSIRSIRAVYDASGEKVVMSCAPLHTFMSGSRHAVIETHNIPVGK